MKGNDDLWDLVESHGYCHVDRGRIPPVLLAVPRAVLEVVCAFALGCLAPFCVGQLKAVHGRGRDEVSQGFAGVNALFPFGVETRPKHRCFASFEHRAGEVVVPWVLRRMMDGVLRLGAALPLSCTR